jgi:small conductance mechanosensitive channel
VIEQDGEVMNEAEEIVSQLSGYGSLIVHSLYFIVAGLLVIFFLYKIAHRFFFAKIIGNRLVTVIFGTLYVLVFVITGLLVLDRLGYAVSAIGQLAIIVVLIGAVIAFFLLPYLPKLPFMIGHMIETGDVLGTVDSISTFHTQIRTFDGNIVFIPNALLMAGRIVNYSYTDNRRVELKLSVGADCDLGRCRQLLHDIMGSDDRVLTEPGPAVFVMDANAAGVDMTGYCWVCNSDWLPARSDLWLQVVDLFQNDPAVCLSLDKQEILLSGEVNK